MAAELFIGIDPGTEISGVVLYNHAARRVLRSWEWCNHAVIDYLAGPLASATCCCIETVASYGMPVGREVFETVLWTGRFFQVWAHWYGSDPRLIYRRDVKLHLCGSARAKDPNIRQALLDKLGKPGTKKEPGPTYGVSGHLWAALAVAVTCAEMPGLAGKEDL